MIGLFTVTIIIMLFSYQCCTRCTEFVVGSSTISPVLIVLPSSPLRSTGKRTVSCSPFSFLVQAVSCSATLGESSVLVCRLVKIMLNSCPEKYFSSVIYERNRDLTNNLLLWIMLTVVAMVTWSVVR